MTVTVVQLVSLDFKGMQDQQVYQEKMYVQIILWCTVLLVATEYRCCNCACYFRVMQVCQERKGRMELKETLDHQWVCQIHIRCEYTVEPQYNEPHYIMNPTITNFQLDKLVKYLARDYPWKWTTFSILNTLGSTVVIKNSKWQRSYLSCVVSLFTESLKQSSANKGPLYYCAGSYWSSGHAWRPWHSRRRWWSRKKGKMVCCYVVHRNSVTQWFCWCYCINYDATDHCMAFVGRPRPTWRGWDPWGGWRAWKRRTTRKTSKINLQNNVVYIQAKLHLLLYSGPHRTTRSWRTTWKKGITRNWCM